MNLDWRKSLRDSRVDQTAKLIGFVLDTFADKHGHCWPSRQTIATGASCDVRTVDMALSRLVGHGFVAIERSRGRHSNHYWLRMPNGERDSRLTANVLRLVGDSEAPATANVAAGNGEPRSPEAGSKPPENLPEKGEAAPDCTTAGEAAKSPDPEVLDLLRRAQRGEFVQSMPA